MVRRGRPLPYRPPTRLTAALAAIAGAVVLVHGTARAAAPPSPWDGVNPFNCVVQDAGTGATGPDPGADPYCVRFDKTHQNFTQLGIVDFLLKEPARTAAAAPKCFYYQEDHWRGSLAQSDGRTVLYEFQGHYFFNKATGDGGMWVTGFSIAGQTFDPTALPGFPPQYGGYFGPGTGGFITHDQVPTDPKCVAEANAHPGAVYRPSGGSRCVPDVGRVDRRRLGPVALGTGERRVRDELGPPRAVKRGFLRWCVKGGGRFEVGQPGDRSGTFGDAGDAPTVIVLSSGRAFAIAGAHRRRVSVGSRRRALGRAFPRARPIVRVRGTLVLRLRPGVIAGLRRGRVSYIGVYDRGAIRGRRALARYLRRAG